jgi:oligopeptide/dipeptide ABC transporter ATP-binding protein
VSVQARILKLLDRLQAELGLAYLVVAHDMAVVKAMATRVAVMYLGEIVEYGPAHAVLDGALHPYTQALRASIPSPDPKRRSGVMALEGDVPSAIDPPPGCRFHTRCAGAGEACSAAVPKLSELAPGHFVACHQLAPRRQPLSSQD